MNREVFNFYPDATYKYSDVVENAYNFTKEKQLMRADLWERFVKQYEIHSDDADLGWKGEFWGKMMRGAALVYSYSQDEKLYKVLEDAVKNLLNTQDELGRIATYSVECEFQNWDLWCRKYVMLGMEYFLEVCKDDALKERIIDAISKQADYIISKIGNEEGKISINATSTYWRGLNSSSILEPIDVAVEKDGAVKIKESEKNVPYECIVKYDVPLKNGKYITLTDYASAGKTFGEGTQMAVWMLTE